MRIGRHFLWTVLPFQALLSLAYLGFCDSTWKYCVSFDEIIRSSTEQLRGTVDVAPPARQGTSSTEQLRGSVDVAPPARQGTDVNGTGSFETEIIVNSSSNVSNGKGSNASNDDNAMDLARQSADLARQSTTSLAPIQLAPIGLLRDHLVLAMGDVGRFNPQNGTYRLNRAFWECYSKKWGASVLFIDPRRFEKCQLHTDWFFRRVCAVASLVEAFVRDSKENVSETADSFGLPVAPRWIFHLDGDSMLSNLDLPLSDFTVPWDREGKSLVFYERFHNGEIAAGNYALRVSELAAQFLRGWERKVSETKNVKFTNSDNGVLHLHLVWYLQKELSFPQGSLQNASHAWASVLRQFRASKDIGSYDRFVALVKLALGPRRDFKHLLVGRRGHGFCADDWTKMYLSKLHVCHHAVKSAAQLVKMIGQSCIDKSLQCLQGPAVCAPQTEREARVKLRNFKPDRFALGNVNDISSCWPNCTRDIPQAVWGQMAVGLQKNGHCLSPRMACCC